MDSENQTVAFLKFSSAKFNEAFIDKGAMRFNTLKYFRKTEKRAGRSDSEEGLASRNQIVWFEFVDNLTGTKNNAQQGWKSQTVKIIKG